MIARDNQFEEQSQAIKWLVMIACNEMIATIASNDTIVNDRNIASMI
jgi:hypothetical protein